MAAINPFDLQAPEQATETSALAQALRLAHGFKLIFVLYEPPQLQPLLAAVTAELPDLLIKPLHFTQPVEHLLDELRERGTSPPPDAVFVFGLEYSLPDGNASAPLIGNLNASRNSFPDAVPCPLVLWTSASVLKAIAHGAPDFFSIRSGVYTLTAELADSTSFPIAGEYRAATNLPLAEKLQAIGTLERQIAEAQKLPSERRDYGIEARLHWRVGNLFFALNEVERARQHYETTLSLARLKADRMGAAVALNSLGNVYYLQGRLAEATKFYEQSLQVFREVRDLSGEGLALTNLGSVHLLTGAFEQAAASYQQSLELFRQISNHPNMAITLNNLGNVYQRMGRLDEAVPYYEQSLTAFRAADDVVGAGITLNNLSNVYERQGRLVEAEQNYRQALEIFRPVGDRRNEAIIFNNLGNIYRMQERWAEAENYLLNSLKIRRELHDRVGESVVLRGMAQIREAMGDLAGAEELERQAANILEMTENEQQAEEARRTTEG